MKEKILLVDDNRPMLKTMKTYLENYGYRVLAADNGSMALMMIKEAKPHLVIADAALQDISGFQLCKIIKSDSLLSHIPVLIISGQMVDEKSIVEGYKKGADDYLIKPFSYNILLAKIRVILRRFNPTGANNVISKFNIKINPSERTVEKAGKFLNLTRKEFDLLLFLIGRENQVLSVPYILDNVWGYDPAVYNDPHTVEVHISRLRKKLGPDIAKRIKKVQGIGYKFDSRNTGPIS